MAFPQFEVLGIGTEMDIATTISGDTARNGMHLAVTDSSTIATGRNTGIYIGYTQSGAKTGGEVMPLVVYGTMTGNLAGNAYMISVYTKITGTPTVNEISCFSCYMNALAGTIEHVFALNLNMVTSARANSIHAFIRCYAHVSTGAKQIFWLDGTGNKCADYFISTPKDEPNLPSPISYVGTGTYGGSGTVYKIAVRFGDTVGYIPVTTTIATS